GVHGLLEEIEPGVGHRAHVLLRLVGAPALVGVSGNEPAGPEHGADAPRALGVDERLVDADLDLEGGVTFGLLLLGLAQIGGKRAGADDAEDRHAAALLAAEQRIGGLPGGAADEVVDRHLDRSLGGAVAVHAVAHRRDRAGDVVRFAPL